MVRFYTTAAVVVTCQDFSGDGSSRGMIGSQLQILCRWWSAKGGLVMACRHHKYGEGRMLWLRRWGLRLRNVWIWAANVLTMLAVDPAKGWTGPSSRRCTYSEGEKLPLSWECSGASFFCYFFFFLLLFVNENIVFECFYTNLYPSIRGVVSLNSY